MQNVVNGAQREIPKYPNGAPPEPAFILGLSNEVYNGASLFAIQKSFKDEFYFDVYYEASDVKQKLDGEYSHVRLMIFIFSSSASRENILTEH